MFPRIDFVPSDRALTPEEEGLEAEVFLRKAYDFVYAYGIRITHAIPIIERIERSGDSVYSFMERFPPNIVDTSVLRIAFEREDPYETLERVVKNKHMVPSIPNASSNDNASKLLPPSSNASEGDIADTYRAILTAARNSNKRLRGTRPLSLRRKYTR